MGSSVVQATRAFVAVGVAATALATGASAAGSLTVGLRGFGKSLGSTSTCPAGLTRIAVVGTDRYAFHCVLSARKVTKPDLDPWRIIERVHVTTSFPGGTIRSVETQTFTFTRSSRTTAAFRGRIVGGTGRFKGATGTVSGGGRGLIGVAVWRVTFRLH